LYEAFYSEFLSKLLAEASPCSCEKIILFYFRTKVTCRQSRYKIHAYETSVRSNKKKILKCNY